MHLYHVPQSRSSRVLWMLEEIGEPYDVTVMAREDRQTPEHRARHPLGRVPVVDDGEGFVYESAGIILHLADLHPGKALAPALGTHDRALLYQWLLFSMTELEVPLVEIYIQKFVADAADEGVVEAAGARFREAAKVVEDGLAGREYLVGNRFSAADVVCGEVCMFGRMFELLDGLPGVSAYVERLEARPAYQRAAAVEPVPASA